MGDVTVGLISYRCRVRCDKGNNSLAHNCVFNRQQWKDHGKEEYNIKGLDSCLRDEFIVALWDFMLQYKNIENNEKARWKATQIWIQIMRLQWIIKVT